ncbi:MAG: hypothetical protein ACOYM3_22775 [Terrimicrobiaceae bacterium]
MIAGLVILALLTFASWSWVHGGKGGDGAGGLVESFRKKQTENAFKAVTSFVAKQAPVRKFEKECRQEIDHSVNWQRCSILRSGIITFQSDLLFIAEGTYCPDYQALLPSPTDIPLCLFASQSHDQLDFTVGYDQSLRNSVPMGLLQP